MDVNMHIDMYVSVDDLTHGPGLQVLLVLHLPHGANVQQLGGHILPKHPRGHVYVDCSVLLVLL